MGEAATGRSTSADCADPRLRPTAGAEGSLGNGHWQTSQFGHFQSLANISFADVEL